MISTGYVYRLGGIISSAAGAYLVWRAQGFLIISFSPDRL